MNIKSMRPVTNCGKTVAFFSVEWPGNLTVNDCKLIEGAQGLFTGTPQKEYTQDGQKKYKSIVFIERGLLDKITAAAQAEYQHMTGAPPDAKDDDLDIPF